MQLSVIITPNSTRYLSKNGKRCGKIMLPILEIPKALPCFLRLYKPGIAG
ncbi:hypothetical protein LEP1GSC120_2314 [Leptospira santarosai str. 200702252]|nr:hypothetical protein LEP1GSC120_0777 [Leptospira santarosai str. 200702252]EMO99167.1 hypothetical protein LEP1GSC120_2314 [Leptospira santarosai str. 200702252]